MTLNESTKSIVPPSSTVEIDGRRILDIVVSGTALCALSPLFLILALVIAMEGGTPIFFSQTRIGRNGRPFDIYKFRKFKSSCDQNGYPLTLDGDERLTRVGRILAASKLDELPQLWNILRGDMSLVGPRPPLEREVMEYETHVHRRFLVKPGITGLWQVSGRSNLSWEDTVRLDLFYVENWSITGDIVILWRTAQAVVGSDGAY